MEILFHCESNSVLLNFNIEVNSYPMAHQRRVLQSCCYFWSHNSLDRWSMCHRLGYIVILKRGDNRGGDKKVISEKSKNIVVKWYSLLFYYTNYFDSIIANPQNVFKNPKWAQHMFLLNCVNCTKNNSRFKLSTRNAAPTYYLKWKHCDMQTNSTFHPRTIEKLIQIYPDFRIKLMDVFIARMR